ncbi:hypothetical protein MA16_Dca008749 [Dendrobium catenatum]|uniref:Uncharacterized protein n=1 Tax=Dendrobium catenatum TaxID=906689 RepID=A0A2I0W4Q5_9ASPA|nr:hypothetical protein MA16_Dca008749 [Dendrobium catenatum]
MIKHDCFNSPIMKESHLLMRMLQSSAGRYQDDEATTPHLQLYVRGMSIPSNQESLVHFSLI